MKNFASYINTDFMCRTWGLPSLAAGSVDLLLVDPPYFKVNGEFDFVYGSFEEYLQAVEKWAQEIARVLSPSGSLLYWGHSLKIAYSQVILDRHLKLENSCVWHKLDCRTKKNSPATNRSFPPVTERCLFYSKGQEPEWQPLQCFAEMWERSGLSRKVVDAACGTKNVTQYWFLKRDYTIPTAEKYSILQSLSPNAFTMQYEDLRSAYEKIKADHYSRRRFFSSDPNRLFDVWEYSQQSNITGKYKHPTQKPPRLMRALIETLSRPGALIVSPFGGSAVDGEQAILSGRNWIGYEIDRDYYCEGLERISNARAYATGRSANEIGTGTQTSIFDLQPLL